MKKIAILLGVIAAATAFIVAAQQKENPKTASKETSKATPTTKHKILGPTELTWEDAPPGLPPGAKMAVLDGDPTKKGSFTVRLQTPGGYKIPPHTHPTAERITVISGTFHLEMGDKFDEAAGREMAVGSFAVMPAGMKHFAWNTGESIVQIHSEGPFEIKYVNSADDPRNAKK
jgi:quercetin dioxygenase-like cupin family protein